MCLTPEGAGKIPGVFKVMALWRSGDAADCKSDPFPEKTRRCVSNRTETCDERMTNGLRLCLTRAASAWQSLGECHFPMRSRRPASHSNPMFPVGARERSGKPAHFFALLACLAIVGCTVPSESKYDTVVLQEVFEACVDGVGRNSGRAGWASVDACRSAAFQIAEQAKLSAPKRVPMTQAPAKPAAPKRTRCIVLDGGAFWDCNGPESEAIMAVCKFGGDPGCEDAARAAVDQVWIDERTAANDGAKALYEMNREAVQRETP